MPDFTASATLKDNLYASAVALWAADDVHVSFGHPGVVERNDIVAFMEATSEQDPATFGTSRSRDEVLTQTVRVSVFRAGGPDMEKVASDRAYDLLGALERSVRVTDTTVGGAVLWCFLTSHQSAGATEDQVLASGRLIEIEAVFTAKARVRAA